MTSGATRERDTKRCLLATIPCHERFCIVVCGVLRARTREQTYRARQREESVGVLTAVVATGRAKNGRLISRTRTYSLRNLNLVQQFYNVARQFSVGDGASIRAIVERHTEV